MSGDAVGDHVGVSSPQPDSRHDEVTSASRSCFRTGVQIPLASVVCPCCLLHSALSESPAVGWPIWAFSVPLAACMSTGPGPGINGSAGPCGCDDRVPGDIPEVVCTALFCYRTLFAVLIDEAPLARDAWAAYQGCTCSDRCCCMVRCDPSCKAEFFLYLLGQSCLGFAFYPCTLAYRTNQAYRSGRVAEKNTRGTPTPNCCNHVCHFPSLPPGSVTETPWQWAGTRCCNFCRFCKSTRCCCCVD